MTRPASDHGADTEDERTNGHRNGSAADDTERTGRTVAVRSTRRWRGVVAVVLLAVSAGVLAKRPSLLLVAAVGIAFAAAPSLTSTPTPDFSVQRHVDPETADDGEVVTVSTTVRNEGDGTLFDVRIVDGTPPMLSVCGGSPRRATALRPGEETTVEYELRSRPGRHRFQPTTLLCRDATGSVEVERRVSVTTDIECATRVPTVPLRARSRERSGPLVTDTGGSGLEFHSIREYESGDPASRIDWRGFARTGELMTVTFREERLADVVVCVDARTASYHASSDTEPHAVAHAVDAAGRLGDALFEANHRVGLAAFGRDSCFLPPGQGGDHADRFHRSLATEPALSAVPPESARSTRTTAGPTPGTDRTEDLDRQLETIRARLGPGCQLLLLTPLCDDEAAPIAQRFESGGASVTVISPDVTTAETVGSRVVSLERDHRLTALRNAGIPTVDWDPAEPLGVALSAAGRWQE